MERVQGEWLDLMCCGVSRKGAWGIERLHGGWLVLICCYDICVSSWCLRNPVSLHGGLAGFDNLMCRDTTCVSSGWSGTRLSKAFSAWPAPSGIYVLQEVV